MQSLGPRLLPATDGSSIGLLDLLQSAPEDLGHKWVKVAPNEVKEVNGNYFFYFFPFYKLFIMF